MMNNLSISAKLYLLAGIVASIITGIGIIGIINLKQINHSLEIVYTARVLPITQQNASSSEQVFQNAAVLQHLAEELNKAIAFFKIN